MYSYSLHSLMPKNVYVYVEWVRIRRTKALILIKHLVNCLFGPSLRYTNMHFIPINDKFVRFHLSVQNQLFLIPHRDVFNSNISYFNNLAICGILLFTYICTLSAVIYIQITIFPAQNMVLNIGE